jgi:predicted protein tyrosine phosphatase
MSLLIAGHEFARHLLRHREATDAVIINDPDDEYETVREMRCLAMDHVYLEFYDLKKKSDSHRAPRHEDVKQAIDWYNALKTGFLNDQRTHTVVSCTAGISRSAALAYVLACTDVVPEQAVNVWNPRLHYPNRYIVSLGAEILGQPEMLRYSEDFLADRAARRKRKGKPPKISG